MILIGCLEYRNLPNKGAGRSSKVRSDSVKKKLRFSAFQWWFRIENRTIIKEIMSILAIYDSLGSPQTIGGALIRGGALNWQITVVRNSGYVNQFFWQMAPIHCFLNERLWKLWYWYYNRMWHQNHHHVITYHPPIFYTKCIVLC